ncbi:DedA family protein [bacterium]|nr:DedA family protein [bacterium]
MTFFTNFILSYISGLNYFNILFLMILESSFIPFPSEVVIPPAAYLAQKGDLNIFLVISVGIIGSLLGAIINYYIAYYLGRALVYKIADHRFLKIILINSKKVRKSENFFLRYGGISTFIGRLVPVVRQLISLPAGFSKMKLKKFCFFTFLGSGIWVVVLAILGYFFGAKEDLLSLYFKEISFAFLFLAFIFVILFIFYKKKYKVKKIDSSDCI